MAGADPLAGLASHTIAIVEAQTLGLPLSIDTKAQTQAGVTLHIGATQGARRQKSLSIGTHTVAPAIWGMTLINSSPTHFMRAAISIGSAKTQALLRSEGTAGLTFIVALAACCSRYLCKGITEGGLRQILSLDAQLDTIEHSANSTSLTTIPQWTIRSHVASKPGVAFTRADTRTRAKAVCAQLQANTIGALLIAVTSFAQCQPGSGRGVYAQTRRTAATHLRLGALRGVRTGHAGLIDTDQAITTIGIVLTTRTRVRLALAANRIAALCVATLVIVQTLATQAWITTAFAWITLRGADALDGQTEATRILAVLIRVTIIMLYTGNAVTKIAGIATTVGAGLALSWLSTLNGHAAARIITATPRTTLDIVQAIAAHVSV